MGHILNYELISYLIHNSRCAPEIYFPSYLSMFPGTPQKIKIGDGEEITVIIDSTRLYIYAHGKKRSIITLKYEWEEKYRYLVASDLSWRILDIVQAHTLWWLVGSFLSGLEVV